MGVMEVSGGGGVKMVDRVEGWVEGRSGGVEGGVLWM